jgi:hypothetical protein
MITGTQRAGTSVDGVSVACRGIALAMRCHEMQGGVIAPRPATSTCHTDRAQHT